MTTSYNLSAVTHLLAPSALSPLAQQAEVPQAKTLPPNVALYMFSSRCFTG